MSPWLCSPRVVGLRRSSYSHRPTRVLRLQCRTLSTLDHLHLFCRYDRPSSPRKKTPLGKETEVRRSYSGVATASLAREDGEILAILLIVRQQCIRGNDGRWHMARHEVISVGNTLSMPGSIVLFLDAASLPYPPKMFQVWPLGPLWERLAAIIMTNPLDGT